MSDSSEEIITTSTESSLSLDRSDQKESLSSPNKHNLFNVDNDHINVLKNLQISYNQLESRYLKSLNELEYKFHQQCSYLFEKRSNIINGKYEPTGDECQLKTDSIEIIERQSFSDDTLGIPSFWLHTLKQVPMIADMIEDWDEPILKCLSDIKLQLHMQPTTGFTLEFHFNEKSKQFFHNKILTKFYELQIDPDDDLLFYEGAAIIRSIGCQIDWIDTLINVTKSSQTGESQSSFFDFFTTPTNTDDWKLAADFQIGHYIRENIIPKAILYNTGDIFNDEYELSDNDYDYDDSDEQEYSFKEETGDGEHL
ncbi:unnamed protein product [Rotaria socialis]|uniref:Uncharacterized protein n=2 Tax=Rotaria socialis TaxID=392032 RepID=A0A817PR17_9BILA|nr:unnamed protein product [Rotaria socialis]CAF3235401.1 unnamed protein product [Rotaria socialis]CAF3327678.1 unnamed protein product [Rotaria socialis]CAF4109360.1 unnamed protein product [Rotaria socialis]CAF4365302.1 unnamed protein product [Rotaria socialis]